MLLDKVYKMAQIGGAGRLGRHRSAQKDTGAHGRHPDAHDRDDRSAQEGQPHRKRTREGRSPTTTRWRSTSRRSAATSTSSKRSSTTRCGRCPNIGNFCSSNRFRNFQLGCEDAAEMLPRRFFLQPTPPEQPRHNEPLPMPASDSVRRTFRNLPGPRCTRSTSRFPAPSASVKMSSVPPKPKKTDAACPCEETDGEFSGRPIRLFGIFSYICSNISGQRGRSRPRTAPRIENETP